MVVPGEGAATVAHPARTMRRPARGLVAGSGRRLLGVALLVGLWWVVTATGLVEAQKLPSPAAVLRAGVRLTSSGLLPEAVLASAGRVAVGLTIGVGVGSLLALVVALSQTGENLIDSPVQMLRSLPAVALVPIFVVWLGIGESAKVALIAWATSFPIYINTLGGIRNIDAGYRDLATSLNLSRLTTVRRIVVPGCLPSFLVGLRYAFSLAWIVLIVAEQVNATSGLGYLTAQARLFYEMDVMFVCLIVYGLLGWFSDFVVRALEWRLLRWRRPFPQG